MNTLDRYLLREILLPFFVGLGLFFAVVAFGEMLKISDSVTGLGIGAGDFLSALIYSLPPLLGLLLPVCALFATLLAVGRLASDREIVALCAGGISPFRLLRVPFVVGAILACLAACATLLGEPWGIQGLKRIMAEGAQNALAQGVKPGEFSEWIKGVTFYAETKDEQGLKGIVFSDQRNQDRPVVVSARHGNVLAPKDAKTLVFDLHQGRMLLYQNDSEGHRVVDFEHGQYRLDVGKLVRKKLINVTNAQGKYPPELWRDSNDPERSAKYKALHRVTLHRKIAMPLATIIFALLAVPLAARGGEGARARGFLYSVGIVAAYYYIGRAAELAARAGSFSQDLAAWVPNILGLIALGLLLFRFQGVKP